MNNPKDKTVADQGKPSGGKPSRFSRRNPKAQEIEGSEEEPAKGKEEDHQQ